MLLSSKNFSAISRILSCLKYNGFIQSERLDEPLLGELNTANVGKSVWLVKVPAFLADAWETAAPDSDLGTVTIVESGGVNKMSLTLPSLQDPTLPKRYDLECQAPEMPTFVFSENQTQQLAMEGTVQYRCDLQPEVTGEYMEILRDRESKSRVKDRNLKTINYGTDLHALAPVVAVKKPKEERLRMPKDQLMDQLFRLFEKGSHYDLKSLIQKTNQPFQWLKEVVDEVCIYNVRGPYKGSYELKPQFRPQKMT